MPNKIVHMSICVRGVLRNWRASEWVDCCTNTETGEKMTPDEVMDALFDELAQGHETIPFNAEPCEGFDYSANGGCPGHDVPESESVES